MRHPFGVKGMACKRPPSSAKPPPYTVSHSSQQVCQDIADGLGYLPEEHFRENAAGLEPGQKPLAQEITT
jgi:hypothetical protein